MTEIPVLEQVADNCFFLLGFISLAVTTKKKNEKNWKEGAAKKKDSLFFYFILLRFLKRNLSFRGACHGG